MQLLIRALLKLVVGFIVLATLLFGSAGSLHYGGAWLLLALLFIPMTLLGIVLLILAPKLLRSRVEMKETRGKQRGVVSLSGLLFVACFIVAGLDYRFAWSAVPIYIIWCASLLFILGYMLYAEVMRENRWLSRSVEVVEGQEVVSTGLYGIVRHPMYSATIAMFLAMPLILGSWWALATMLPYIAIIAIRILDEEQLLHQSLAGYTAYCTKVRWRLLPYVW